MNITAGKHVAKAIHAELGHAKTGSEMIAVLFEITEGEYTGQRITWWGYFTEKTAKRTVESLKYTGWRGDWESWDGLGTRRVELDVQEEADGQGGVRMRVQWVNPVSIIKKENAMSAPQRVAFAGKMRGLVQQVLRGDEPQVVTVAPRQPQQVQVSQRPNGQRPPQQRHHQSQRPQSETWQVPQIPVPSDDDVPF